MLQITVFTYIMLKQDIKLFSVYVTTFFELPRLCSIEQLGDL